MTRKSHEPMEDDVIQLTEGLPPQVPDGQYDAVVLSVTKVRAFGVRWIAKFRFQIVTEGPAFELELPAYANLGPTGRTVSPHSKLASWMRVISDFTGGRSDRVSLRSFQDFQFRVRTHTVSTNARNQVKRDYERYSHVADLIAVVGKLAAAPTAHRKDPHVSD